MGGRQVARGTKVVEVPPHVATENVAARRRDCRPRTKKWWMKNSPHRVLEVEASGRAVSLCLELASLKLRACTECLVVLTLVFSSLPPLCPFLLVVFAVWNAWQCTRFRDRPLDRQLSVAVVSRLLACTGVAVHSISRPATRSAAKLCRRVSASSLHAQEWQCFQAGGRK